MVPDGYLSENEVFVKLVCHSIFIFHVFSLVDKNILVSLKRSITLLLATNGLCKPHTKMVKRPKNNTWCV